MRFREEDRGRCSDENREDGSEWTQKDRKTKSCTKRHEGDRGTERNTRPETWRVKKRGE